MTATFRTTRRVEFADTDMAGIVHFSRFFCFMEVAEHELLRSLGLSVVMDCDGQKITFPRVGASCDFLEPVRFEELLTVDVTVENLGRSSITYGFKFFREDRAIARGQLTTVCCRNAADHRLESIPLPDRIRACLEGGGASLQ